jgi:hypothetical protein
MRSSLYASLLSELVLGIAKETVNEKIKSIKQSLRLIAISLVICSTIVFFLSALGLATLLTAFPNISSIIETILNFIQSISIEMFGAGAIILVVELSLREVDKAEMDVLQSNIENVKYSLDKTQDTLNNVANLLYDETRALGEQVTALSQLIEKQSKQ